MKLCYPLNLPFMVTQKFGENLTPLYAQYGLLGHNGIDYAVKDGTPVYATHDGVVVFAGHDNSAGLGIVIRTDLVGKNYKTIYWHLKEGSVVVKVDQRVKKGEKIAEADNTGASTGTHLHFGMKEIRQGEDSYTWYNENDTNGYKGAIDPFPFFTGEHPNTITPELPEHFTEFMASAKKFQLTEGIQDFANEQDLRRIRIGNKTLKALKKYQK